MREEVYAQVKNGPCFFRGPFAFTRVPYKIVPRLSITQMGAVNEDRRLSSFYRARANNLNQTESSEITTDTTSTPIIPLLCNIYIYFLISIF